MLRYFRINDPYRLLGLLAIMVLIYLPLLVDTPGITFPELKSIVVGEKVHEGHALYKELVDSTAPLAGWFDGLFDVLFGRSLLARHILAFFIIFSQAAFLGLVFIDKKAFGEGSFAPALLFVLLFAFSFDTLALSAELLGSGFLLLALNGLFKEIEFREQRNETIFNLGLFIGISSLFSFSFSIYLLGAIIILAIYTRNPTRKYLLMIFGFLIPHFLILSIYFLRDGFSEIWTYYYLPNLGFSGEMFITAKSLWILGIIPLFYLLISFVILNREARFTKYQSQLVQSMFFWMIFSVLQVLYSKDLRPQSFITLVPSFSFFIAHFLLLIRKKRLAEFNLWVILIGIVSVSYLARYNKLDSLTYEKLLVKESSLASAGIPADKKILMLGDDLAAYKNNTPATSFINWELAREIFEQPDYYENVIKVRDAFKRDAPDVIIDPEKLMGKFFARIPELRRQYKPSPEGYRKINDSLAH